MANEIHENEHAERVFKGTSPSLWAGVLGAPVLWSAELIVTYALVPRACLTHHDWTLHLSTALFLCLTLAGGLVCWLEWRRVRDATPSGADASVPGRNYFLAVLGVLTSGLFALLIFAQGLMPFFLNACWD